MNKLVYSNIVERLKPAWVAKLLFISLVEGWGQTEVIIRPKRPVDPSLFQGEMFSATG